MKPVFLSRCLAPLAIVLAAMVAGEVTARWWMRPGRIDPHAEILKFRVPDGEPAWRHEDEAFAKVRPLLHCSDGWIGGRDFEDGRGMHISYSEWNPGQAGAPTHALIHMPEQCMGAIGMVFEESLPPREFALPNGEELVFDVTRFSTPGPPFEKLFVFKAVWIEGAEGVNLRNGIFGGGGSDLRRYRVEAAKHRFSPSHSRVIMGTFEHVEGVDEAWERFQTFVLSRLELTRPPAPTS